MKITVHTVVKNEDIWVWFAVQSVLPFVDKIIIFDTGSEDKTVDVIKTINSDKIVFEERGSVDRKGLVKLRQEQLDRTETDWFLILDGDEIWPEDQLKGLLKSAESAPANTVATFNKVRNCIGDVYHYLPESTGKYEIAGVKGNLNMRLIKKTKDLKIEGEYPLEAYVDKNGPLQNQVDDLIFADYWYLHTSFLKRSSTISTKVSGSFGKSKLWQKGLKLREEELPAVLKADFPSVVEKPLSKRGLSYEILAHALAPAISIKKSFKK